MVSRRRRKDRKSRSLMGNHQRAWLRGHHAVMETLEAGRWIPLELVLSTDLSLEATERASRLAVELGVELKTAPSERLTELCHARDHQGLIARMPEFPYESVEQVLSRAGPVPLMLILEAVQDPFNFGSILRSASVFGVDGVFVGSHGQAEINSQVVRSSAGAVNRLAICRVDSPISLLEPLKASGVKTLATSSHAEARIDTTAVEGPLALVIGNEGAGVTPELLERCDELVTIPQATDFESLNAAVSAGIVLYEVHRQRTGPSSGSPA